MLTAPRMVRTERAVRPCLPITLPTSCGATLSLRTVFSSRSTDSTATAAGSSTKACAISLTSSVELERDAREVTRQNLHRPLHDALTRHVALCLAGNAPVIAATDYVRAYPQLIAPYVAAPY